MAPEKAVLACSSAVREWDSNGTNFGYNPERDATAGEFGHNDFYPVAVAAAQIAGLDGRQTLVAMAVLDEIRGRLAEVFALKNHKIDHVVHGAIASAAVYGAMLGATRRPDRVGDRPGGGPLHSVSRHPPRPSAFGFQRGVGRDQRRSRRAQHAASDARLRRARPISFATRKRSSACSSRRTSDETSPFDLALATAGDDFAVMGMHFKLGLYEHQSAGAIQGMINLIAAEPKLLDDPDQLLDMRILIYEPAFSIIGDPHKRDPKTRQSADHSMVYIIATLLRKAYEARRAGWDGQNGWQQLMLAPADYAEDESALFHPLTRRLMQHIDFRHGGPDFDRRYPDGIPTTSRSRTRSWARSRAGW